MIVDGGGGGRGRRGAGGKRRALEPAVFPCFMLNKIEIMKFSM